MKDSYEAIVDEDGYIRSLRPVPLSPGRRAIVTITDTPAPSVGEPGETATNRGSWKMRYKPIGPEIKGGMGRAIKVQAIDTGNLMCLKFLHPRVDKRALLQECRALARLSHEHIVRLLDFDTQDSVPYIVTEYVDGPLLSGYAWENAPLEQDVAIELAKQLFDAVAYLHSQNLIHRDLKPDNVIIRDPWNSLAVVLIDFGLAIVDLLDYQERLTGAGHVIGTLGYMSPEQAAGLEVTGACDVYAVGVMVWELLVGRPAFRGRTQAVMKSKLTTKHLEVPRTVPAIENLAELVRRCTLHDPLQRPKPEEALEILRNVPIGRREKYRSWLRTLVGRLRP